MGFNNIVKKEYDKKEQIEEPEFEPGSYVNFRKELKRKFCEFFNFKNTIITINSIFSQLFITILYILFFLFF